MNQDRELLVQCAVWPRMRCNRRGLFYASDKQRRKLCKRSQGACQPRTNGATSAAPLSNREAAGSPPFVLHLHNCKSNTIFPFRMVVVFLCAQCSLALPKSSALAKVQQQQQQQPASGSINLR